ncbi:UvrB/UvrC motif-containing protein [Thermoflavimicrobium dichotomicum]|uniref:Protein arginine kinase activator n=1 Tax=Thermoflavimicrobium dichotomicum TaxID=46223 RepID=A0A1I3QSZ5_9BACL|nr:UvrB/UvrC motif-containing protein [Thermoflavimicrobium dichotomicum]SFJ37015.1 protein arginine kinase activator [Thermoflavimicrobium dichotomicum]
MLCPECGKRPATIHYTKIINGNKTEQYLCEVCAHEKGDVPTFENGFSFQKLLSSFLNFEPSFSEHESRATVKHQTLRCPTCGMTYNQFGKFGRFGCSDCYYTFRTHLEPMLRRIHGHTTHRGKIPERTKGALKIRRKLELLKEELARKVQAEEFEEAAKIRDQIRALQEQLEQ